MSQTSEQNLLEALLDSWDRNNTIMVGFLQALPAGALEARAVETSPNIARLLMHIYFVRLATVAENAPESATEFIGVAPNDDQEWRNEHDTKNIVKMLNDSAKIVRDAMKSWALNAEDKLVDYDHPILLLQHMIWHEAYHLGQMKLALKATGQTMSDKDAGPVTWNIWRRARK